MDRQAGDHAGEIRGCRNLCLKQCVTALDLVTHGAAAHHRQAHIIAGIDVQLFRQAAGRQLPFAEAKNVLALDDAGRNEAPVRS